MAIYSIKDNEDDSYIMKLQLINVLIKELDF